MSDARDAADPSSATTAEYRAVSIWEEAPCVTLAPGATRMSASTFHPSSSSAAVTNFVSQFALPMTRTRPIRTLSGSEARAVVPPTFAITLPLALGTKNLVPPPAAFSPSISPRSSSMLTLFADGAAASTVKPPRGDGTGATDTAANGRLPLHATSVPARDSARIQSRWAGAGVRSSCKETRSGARPETDQSRSAGPRFAERAETTRSGRPRSSESHSINARIAMLSARSAVSIAARTLAREGIDDDVHAKACVVHGREALVVRVVVPLRAVILVAVEHGNPIAT